jgi:glycosyltransferase involved in cell wall biosynthesis
VKQLRVLHLDSGTTWRGGQRQALLLALGLREMGHEPYLIGSPGSPLIDRARAAGLPVAGIQMSADWDVRAARRIRARMHAWRIDLVHAHDARSHAVGIIALLRNSRVPLVVTRRVAFQPRSVRLKYGPRVARFIAISNAVREAMIGGGIDPSRIAVVHSGIQLPGSIQRRNWRAELDWPDDSIVAGVVGAMTAEKGLGALEQIAPSLPEAVRRRLRIVLLGGSTVGSMSIGGIESHSAGFVTDIENAIAGLDILLHPSSSEGLGTSIIDAMALGVPPLAFRVGGIPEVIEDSVTGLLAPPGDMKAFGKNISRLAEDAGLRAKLGAAAGDRAKDFSADAMTKGTEAVYQEVLPG